MATDVAIELRAALRKAAERERYHARRAANPEVFRRAEQQRLVKKGPTYYSWRAMRQRCLNPADDSFI